MQTLGVFFALWDISPFPATWLITLRFPATLLLLLTLDTVSPLESLFIRDANHLLFFFFCLCFLITLALQSSIYWSLKSFSSSFENSVHVYIEIRSHPVPVSLSRSSGCPQHILPPDLLSSSLVWLISPSVASLAASLMCWLGFCWRDRRRNVNREDVSVALASRRVCGLVTNDCYGRAHPAVVSIPAPTSRFPTCLTFCPDLPLEWAVTDRCMSQKSFLLWLFLVIDCSLPCSSTLIPISSSFPTR